MSLTLEQVQPIVQKYVGDWNRRNPRYPLWASLASPGDAISVPGVTFSTTASPRAGMELPIHNSSVTPSRGRPAGTAPDGRPRDVSQ